MEAIIFIGIQASGKTTFYNKHFSRTHTHISLDVLKTRHKEKCTLEGCLNSNTPFVIV